MGMLGVVGVPVAVNVLVFVFVHPLLSAEHGVCGLSRLFQATSEKLYS